MNENNLMCAESQLSILNFQNLFKTDFLRAVLEHMIHSVVREIKLIAHVFKFLGVRDDNI